MLPKYPLERVGCAVHARGAEAEPAGHGVRLGPVNGAFQGVGHTVGGCRRADGRVVIERPAHVGRGRGEMGKRLIGDGHVLSPSRARQGVADRDHSKPLW